MKRSIRYVFLICVFAFLLCAAGCTKEGYVASKVTIGGVDIGGMTREEAISALEGLSLDDNQEVVILADGDEIVLSAKEVGALYNAEKTADAAIENSKGFFSGWLKKEYAMEVDIDAKLLDSAVKEFETEGAATSAVIVDDGIMVTNAYPSKKLDRDELIEKIAEAFGKADAEKIEMSYMVNQVEGASDSEVLNALVNEYKEPEYIKDENGEIYVTESSIGVIFDMNEALSVMKLHTEEGESYLIACEVQKPEHTKEELEGALFRDTLASYSTNFSTSSANRCSNIALATSSINNLILMPGDIFSFNGSVGERTTSRGYKTAGAYVAGETVDQVGGGICQVSSTLYNSVLLSNLEIVERRSHQMTVSYVPMGRDATVNWGTTDFRFKNNTAYPVKIVGTINGKNVTISMVGTATIDNMKVEILTNTVSVLEPPVETVEDPEKEVGYTNTKSGSKGYVVDATRVVYSNGAEISRESLVRSRYNPKKTVVTVGTKVVEVPIVPEDDYQMPPGLMPVEEQAAIPAA